MRLLLAAAALLCSIALPAAAEDYYSDVATAKDGNGYVPATIVAGWVKRTSFSVIAFIPDGDRKAKTAVAKDWKATVLVAPKAAPRDDIDDDPRYLDLKATTPKNDDDDKAAAEPPVVRKEVTYSSHTCPALAQRMAALKPLTSFEYNPPDLRGNLDGPKGDGHQGFDLWVRVGDGELSKSSNVPASKLGHWFQATAAALSKCPATVTQAPSASGPG